MATKQRVLVVAAHPDDEVLGCGGTLAKHSEQEDIIHTLFLTDGESARREVAESSILQRKESAQAAGKLFGTQEIEFLSYPDNQLDTIPLLELTQAVESTVSFFKPTIIYTHYGLDLNIDHQLTCKAVITACRPQPGLSVKSIYSFPIRSSTEWSMDYFHRFNPNYYVALENKHVQLKQQALQCYNNELRNPPHTRSLKAILLQDELSGASIGAEYAEAFMLVRKIA